MDPKKRKYCPLYCGSNRNSFDRFGDDLCEVILQYLSYEDKIRFECVSKQWKRYIYCRQYVLHICLVKSNDNINGLLAKKLLSFYDESITELKNVSIVERVLQKCPQIRCILIRSHIWLYGSLTYDQLLRIIADNCSHLTSIIINFRLIESSDVLKYFGEKCGKSLKAIGTDCYEEQTYGGLLEYCTNLVSIHRLNLEPIIDTKNMDKILCPNLREIKELTLGGQRNDLMDRFVDRYKNTLKTFDANFLGHDCCALFAQISKLTKLETLQLKLPNIPSHDFSRFMDGLTKIGANCVQIKRLSMQAITYYLNNILYALLTAMNESFNQLNYLDVKTRNMNVDWVQPNMSIMVIRNCAHIKRLKINSSVDTKFFVNVDKYLPHLVFIEIVTNNRISDEMLDSLSKLKNLRSINIEIISNAEMSITDTGICNLIDNCLFFRSFTFNPCPRHITEKTINKFMEISRNRPKTNFSHIFRYSIAEDIETIESIVNKYSKNFAQNLSVQFKMLPRAVISLFASRGIRYFTR